MGRICNMCIHGHLKEIDKDRNSAIVEYECDLGKCECGLLKFEYRKSRFHIVSADSMMHKATTECPYFKDMGNNGTARQVADKLYIEWMRFLYVVGFIEVGYQFNRLLYMQEKEFKILHKNWHFSDIWKDAALVILCLTGVFVVFPVRAFKILRGNHECK